MQVLHAIGVLERVLDGAIELRALDHRDKNGHLSARKELPLATTFRISRRHLIETLAQRAIENGAEIRYSSAAFEAEPSGVLVTRDGGRWPADLVVAADGVNSALRDSLGLPGRQRVLGDGTFRFRLSAFESSSLPAGRKSLTEWWSGSRRVLHIPSQAGWEFFALSCHTNDVAGRTFPLDVQSWSDSFPILADVFGRLDAELTPEAAHWTEFRVVRMRDWSSGAVAVVGDAAHGMAPNIGQGGGTALMDGLSLATRVQAATDIPAALRSWQHAERPLIDSAQRWAGLYSALTYWPHSIRTPILTLCGRAPLLRNSMSKAANTTPTGAVGLPASLGSSS